MSPKVDNTTPSLRNAKKKISEDVKMKRYHVHQSSLILVLCSYLNLVGFLKVNPTVVGSPAKTVTLRSFLL